MMTTIEKDNIKINLHIFSNSKIEINKALEDFHIVDSKDIDFSIFFVDKNTKIPHTTKKDIVLLNQDINYNLTPIKANLITYGIDNKASVTTSSINSLKEDEAIICIQRKFKDIYSNTIEPMELKFKNCDYNVKNISTLIGIYALKIICGCW